MVDRANTHPMWLIEVAIEPKPKADREKLDIALAKLAAQDPSFHVSTDRESGQTILKGMGELHLHAKIDILRRTYNVNANIGALQVAFRERVTRRVEVTYTYKKVRGPKGEFAHVKFVVESNEPDSGFKFESRVDENVVFGYLDSLDLLSQERATVAMQFDHYAPVPLRGDDPPFRPAIGMRA